MAETPFWTEKSLDEMSDAEWESLCDGCALCCLQKLEDVDTGDVAYTRVACELLDCRSCRCSNYPERLKKVSACTDVRSLIPDKLHWLPWSCAYRRLAEGRELAPWHPLLSGDNNSTQLAGISVAAWAVPQSELEAVDAVDDNALLEHMIEISDLPGQ